MSDDVVGSLFDEMGDTAADVPAVERPIVVASFPVDQVVAEDKVRFNTNNHHNYRVDPSDPTRLEKLPAKTRVDDYEAVLDRVKTHLWVDLFHAHYRVVNIARHHLTWMKTASVVACQKAGLSPLFAEDIEDTVGSTDTGSTFRDCRPGEPSTGYFVRTDQVSLKDGMHGVGPYYNLSDMLASAVTARMGHQGVDGTTKHLKFYLLPWIETLHPHREFRVFVCRRRVTCISQQSLYQPNKILSTLASDGDVQTVIRNWCQRLLPYIEDVVLSRITWIDDFAIDIALLAPSANDLRQTYAEQRNALRCGGPPSSSAAAAVDPDALSYVDVHAPHLLKPYFIEINPFGFPYSSGSSLFSWVEDYAILYGVPHKGTDQDAVHFRYTTTASTSAS